MYVSSDWRSFSVCSMLVEALLISRMSALLMEDERRRSSGMIVAAAATAAADSEGSRLRRSKISRRSGFLRIAVVKSSGNTIA